MGAKRDGRWNRPCQGKAGRRYGTGVCVAHLALCKESGIVDCSCMVLASRGNSLRRGAGSSRDPHCDYWLFPSNFRLFFYGACFLLLGLSELAVVGFPLRNASAQQC